jgi:hypothetical protein
MARSLADTPAAMRCRRSKSRRSTSSKGSVPASSDVTLASHIISNTSVSVTPSPMARNTGPRSQGRMPRRSGSCAVKAATARATSSSERSTGFSAAGCCAAICSVSNL